MQPYLGEIRMFAGNFAPQGWALCSGQLMSIAQNTALFSLLGTIYGGDGQSTFALPDFRGRVPLHQGQGQTQSFTIGEQGGTEAEMLTAAQLPPHTHVLSASAAAPQAVPAGGINLSASAYVPASPVPKPKMYANPDTLVAMSSSAIGAAGGSQPHDNMAPSLGLNFIIALEGIFPSRS
jgi:microcystin-dependent protein